MTGSTGEPPGDRIAYSVNEAAAITGLSRDLLYDQIRAGQLAYLKSAAGASSPASTWKPSSPGRRHDPSLAARHRSWCQRARSASWSTRSRR